MVSCPAYNLRYFLRFYDKIYNDTVCYHQYRPHYGNCTVTSYLCCSIHYVVLKYYQEVYCCDCVTKDPGYEFLTAAGHWKLKGGCLVQKIDF